MEKRDTDPRFLVLLLAVLEYIDSRNKPTNPFVKGFGMTENTQNAYEFLLSATEDCKDFIPELEEMVAVFELTKNPS